MFLLKIRTDDRGNKALKELGANAKKAKGDILPLGQVLKTTFVATGVIRGLMVLRRELFSATDEARKFETAVTRVSAIGGVTGQSLDVIRQGAKELALETEFSASRITESLLSVVKMGYEAEGALEILPHAMDLATASMEDLSWASTNMINIMNAFNLESQESERVANVMATAFNATSLNLKEYMEAMTYAAPIAHALGVSLEETSAMLGVLSDQSIRGSLGGTTIKNTLLRLLSPTESVKNALEGLNFEGMSATQVLGALHDAGVSTQDMLEQFNMRAVAGALSVGEKADAVEDLIEVLLRQGVSAKEVASLIRQDYVYQLDMAKNALHANVIELNELLNPYKIQGIKFLGRQFRNLRDYIEENREEIDNILSSLVDFATYAKDTATPVVKLFVEHWETFAYLGLSAKLYGAAKGLAAIKTTLLVTNPPLLALVATIGLLNHGLDRIYGRGKSERIDKQLGNWNNLHGDEHIAELEKLEDALNRRDELISKIDSAGEGLSLLGRLKSNLNPESELSGFRNELQAINMVVGTVQRNLQETFGKDYADILGIDLWDIDSVEQKLNQLRTVARAISGREVIEIDVEESDGLDEKVAKVKNKLMEGFGQSGGRIEGVDAMREVQQMMRNFDYGQDLLNNWHETNKQKWIEYKEQTLRDLEEAKARRTELLNGFSNFANASVGLITNLTETMAISQRRATNRILESLREEQAAIEHRYSREMSLAGTSAFRRQMLEQQVADKKKKHELEIRELQEQTAKEEHRRQIFIGGLNVLASTLSVFAQQPGGLLAKLAAGATILATATGYYNQIKAVNYRHGSKGEIRGEGNSTSDSILANLSVGERVLSASDTQKLGGHEAVNRMIDRGDHYSDNRGVNLYVQNYIGTRQYTRDIISQVEQELTRRRK